ncbi:MAG TPA: hypothetical protein VEB40_14410 [Flavipsychrobacter sp.]|nr:hypothetical protein [Flavipsychrobacter sp.]
MSCKKTPKLNLYDYIEPYLDKGADAIAGAKKEYYRLYKAEWRRRYRSTVKQYSVCLDAAEQRQLKTEGRKHKKSVTGLIKSACFAYLNRVYLIQDLEVVNSVRQLLAQNYNALLELAGEKALNQKMAIDLLRRIQTLEAKVMSKLFKPRTLEDWIIQTITENPRHIESLKLLLEKYDK